MTAAVLTADAIAPDLDGAAISRYAALGDSFTAGAGAGRRRWTDGLAARLGTGNPGFAHRNFAQAGATSGDVLALQVPQTLEFGPELVTVVCGINDVLLPAHPDFARYAARLKEIVLALRKGAPGALIVTATCPNLASRLPLTERVLERLMKEIDLLNEVTRSLAGRLDVPYVELTAEIPRPSPRSSEHPRVFCAARGTEAESVAEAFGEVVETVHATALAGA